MNGSNSRSEILVKLPWFFIHVKNPNTHSSGVVIRILKFCELVTILGFTYLMVKIFLFSAH